MTRIAISLGDEIGGRYHLEAVLGHGGMAIVYRARHTGTGKACALKIVHPHLISRNELVEMFLREARVAGRMGDHPNVVTVFDAGVDESRRVPFMVMELLEGQTLEQYLDAAAPVCWPLVHVLTEQLADALEHAHRAGIVHRDLKPGNLFLTTDRKGQPVLKVMDFGIAKVLEQAVEGSITKIGSPLYAAPEQQAGDGFRRLAEKQGVTIAREVSPATDVWAIGLIVYELLTGLSKAQVWGSMATANDLLVKVVLEPAPVPSTRAGERASLLPRGFDAWFTRCLMKNAAERWRSAREAVGALLTLLEMDDRKRTQPMVIIPKGAPLPLELRGNLSTWQTESSAEPKSSQPTFDENIAPGGTIRISRPEMPPSLQRLLTKEPLAPPISQGLPLLAVDTTAPFPNTTDHQPAETLSAVSPDVGPRLLIPAIGPEVQDLRRRGSSTESPVARTLARPRHRKLGVFAFGAVGGGAVAIVLLAIFWRRETPEVETGKSRRAPDLMILSPVSLTVENDSQRGPTAAGSSPAPNGVTTVEAGNASEASAPTDSATKGTTSVSEQIPRPAKRTTLPEKGLINITSRGVQCAVTINGRRLGQTPQSRYLDPGTLLIRCVTGAGKAQDKSVDLKAGKQANVSFVWSAVDFE